MKKLNSISIITSSLILGLLFVITSCNNANKNNPEQEVAQLSDEEIMSIASKAYIYGYPTILLDLTKKVGTNVEAPGIEKSYAPINQFGHFREFPDHNFTGVVKPNVDTYYSIVWFDLSKEAFVLGVPETDRYYLLPMLDAYSNVFSVPGTRTTGTEAQEFLVTGPFWEGKVPEGMTLIQSPTSLVWLLGRTQVNSKEDGATVVKEIQDGFTLVPLSSYGKDYIQPKGKVVEAYKSIVPVKDIDAMPIATYFNELAHLMVNNPPLKEDEGIVKEMAKIGIVAGQPFSMDNFSEEVQAKLMSIPATTDQTFKSIVASQDPSTLVNGWGKAYQTPIFGDYGTDYNFRALIAYVGLGANLRKDAVYPNTTLDGEGNLLDAQNKYVLHFEKEQLPPVDAFWSLTMYNDKNFLAENPINRYALGDRDELSYNEDGSLDVYVQRESPGEAKESNWLPTPETGNFELTLRLYLPKKEVLNGTWLPVPVQKVK